MEEQQTLKERLGDLNESLNYARGDYQYGSDADSVAGYLTSTLTLLRELAQEVETLRQMLNEQKGGES